MMANGVSENEPPCVANDELCQMHTSYKYHDRDTLCISCLGKQKAKGKEKQRKKEKENGSEKEKEEEEENDEKRDKIFAIFPHPLYDSKKR